MRNRALRVSALRITPPSPGDQDRGLVAFLKFRVGGIELDGVTLRRRRDGRLAICYPSRRDARGRRHPFVRFGEAERRSVERQVLEILGAEVSP